MPEAYHSCYLRRGFVYLPTMGRFTRGGYRAVEPVAVIPVSDTAGLRRALMEAMARGSPAVPSLRGHEYPPSPLLKHAKVKSWSTFQRGASLWGISVDEDGTRRIVGWRPRPRGRGWEPDPERTITFPPEAGAEALCDRLIPLLQEAASK